MDPPAKGTFAINLRGAEIPLFCSWLPKVHCFSFLIQVKDVLKILDGIGGILVGPKFSK